jgi:hypothetical protein
MVRQVRGGGARLGLVAALACGSVALSGCSVNLWSHAAPTPGVSPGGSPSGGGTAPPYYATDTPSATPTGPATTPAGTTLDLGKSAAVVWQAGPGEQVTMTIRVTKLVSTTYAQSFAGWKVPAQTRKSTLPYFVRATLTNTGRTVHLRSASIPVPLYGYDSRKELVQSSTFGSTFSKCEPSVMPATFKQGASLPVCLVVLVPHRGKLLGATYRPTAQSAPITWAGATQPLKGAKHHGHGGSPTSTPTSTPTP